MSQDLYKNKYRIPSTRLQGWNYSSVGAYFITICTKNREHFFGKVQAGKMVLSPIGIIADILWHEIKNHAENVDLEEFVVMPNHIHGILVLTKIKTREELINFKKQSVVGKNRFQHQGKNTVSSIIGSYKSAVSKHAHRLGFQFEWHVRFYDIIIRDSESFHRISEYIKNNPSKWEQDKFF